MHPFCYEGKGAYKDVLPIRGFAIAAGGVSTVGRAHGKRDSVARRAVRACNAEYAILSVLSKRALPRNL